MASRPPQLFRRRRARLGRLAVVTAVAAAGIVPVLWTAGGEDAPPITGAASAGAAEPARLAVPPAPPVEPGAPVALPAFATFQDVTLHVPASDVLLIGYHEASFANAQELVPVGELVTNDNRTKFTPPLVPGDGPGYVVMSSRGRPRPATSAVDVVLADETPVHAPVSGTVREVRPYLLYGRHDDVRIEIVPDGRPDLSIVVIHVEGVRVRPGDHVEGGVSVIASGPNRFPFGSQIDRFLEPERWPHVHIEIKTR